MIADHIHAALADATAALAPVVGHLDLRFQVNVLATPPIPPNGGRGIIAQIIVSAVSPMIGRRLWEVAELADVDQLLHDTTGADSFVRGIATHFDQLARQLLTTGRG